MALPQPNYEWDLSPVARKIRRDVVRVADSTLDTAVPSPARTLQASLAAELQPEDRKWPPAVSVAFVLVTCGSFWWMVGVFVSRLLHHV